MALTISSGMTKLSAADSATNWVSYRLAGSGQFSGTPNVSTDVFLEGTASLSNKFNANNQDSGNLFDYYTANGNTALDMSSGNGNEVFGIWVQVTTPSKILNRASGGLYLIVQFSTATGASNAPSNYAKWYVKGADVYSGGWVFLMIDSRKTPSVTSGTVNWTNVCRLGVGITNVASVGTILADNFFSDAIFAGRPVYEVLGDGTLVADWADFLSDSETQFNGLIEDVGGVYLCYCGFKFGDNAQTATTTFQDATGTQIVFKRLVYDTNGSGLADGLDYNSLYNVTAEGAASFGTTVELGTVVGTGDDRQGVLGGALRSESPGFVPIRLDFQTDITHLTSIKLYGVTFYGFTDGLDFDNNAGATVTDLISVSFINCGEVDPGTTGGGATILGGALIDPQSNGGTNRGMILRNGNNVKNLACITSGTPSAQKMIHIVEGGTVSISFDGVVFYGDYSSIDLYHGEISTASAAITINAVNGANPVEAEFDLSGAGASVTVVNSVNFVLTNVVSGTTIFVEAATGGPLSVGTTIIAAETISTDPYTKAISYTSDQPFKCLLANASGDPVYAPVLFNDTIGANGFTRRIEQQLD